MHPGSDQQEEPAFDVSQRETAMPFRARAVSQVLVMRVGQEQPAEPRSRALIHLDQPRTPAVGPSQSPPHRLDELASASIKRDPVADKIDERTERTRQLRRMHCQAINQGLGLDAARARIPAQLVRLRERDRHEGQEAQLERAESVDQSLELHHQTS